uniref:Uncharacterized protein n=1 Tax=Zooxanthella nutricula TaxID=1333877 RepID=A0A7S2KF57_9DINO
MKVAVPPMWATSALLLVASASIMDGDRALVSRRGVGSAAGAAPTSLAQVLKGKDGALLTGREERARANFCEPEHKCCQIPGVDDDGDPHPPACVEAAGIAHECKKFSLGFLGSAPGVDASCHKLHLHFARRNLGDADDHPFELELDEGASSTRRLYKGGFVYRGEKPGTEAVWRAYVRKYYEE